MRFRLISTLRDSSRLGVFVVDWARPLPRRREDAKKSPSFWLRLCWGRGILGGFFCWPRITRIKFSKASERAAAASQSGAPLLTLKMRPGVVALKEILPQGLLP